MASAQDRCGPEQLRILFSARTGRGQEPTDVSRHQRTGSSEPPAAAPRPPPSTACLPASCEAEIPAPSIKVARGTEATSKQSASSQSLPATRQQLPLCTCSVPLRVPGHLWRGADGQVHPGSRERGRTGGHHPGGQRPPHSWGGRPTAPGPDPHSAGLGPQGSRCRFSVTLNSHVTLPTNVLPRAV